MKPKPRKTPWRHRRLTRREELASVWVLFLLPVLMVALSAPLSWCSAPETADMAEPAAIVERADGPVARGLSPAGSGPDRLGGTFRVAGHRTPT